MGRAHALVGRSGTRPWLFAFVGVASLCLTQMAYHYLRGANSVYVDYEQGCGECTHSPRSCLTTIMRMTCANATC